MISPDGFAISPLIPASCRIWAVEPRAPESAIIKTLLKDRSSCSSSSVVLSSLTFSPPSSFIISSATFSVTCAHISMTLLYRSPFVMRPSAYCRCMSIVSCSALVMRTDFFTGTCMSSMQIEVPDCVANLNPVCSMLSRKTTVACFPAVL